MESQSIPTLKYWDRIAAFTERLNLPPIEIFAVFIYLNNGQFAWLANRKESVQEYVESGLYRADILQCKAFRKDNRVIYTEEYASLDPVQQSIKSLMDRHGFSRIYCLSRFCSDCSLLLAANNKGGLLANPQSIYEQTVSEFEQFCCEFIDGMLDVYVEALPALDKTRFATDQAFRHMVIKNRCCSPEARLSDGEREVLYWAGHGKTSYETALLMQLAQSTVETYRKRAIAKLAASNVTHAVYLAKLYLLIP